MKSKHLIFVAACVYLTIMASGSGDASGKELKSLPEEIVKAQYQFSKLIGERTQLQFELSNLSSLRPRNYKAIGDTFAQLSEVNDKLTDLLITMLKYDEAEFNEALNIDTDLPASKKMDPIPKWSCSKGCWGRVGGGHVTMGSSAEVCEIVPGDSDMFSVCSSLDGEDWWIVWDDGEKTPF